MVTTDPVASDLVTSLAHPAGNITGLSAMTKELTAKRLELLKETVPTLVRVAVLWNPDSPMEAQIAEELKAAARPLSLELHFVGLRTREEISAASSAISRAHAKAMWS
jgi:putative ABC transport system substrate-binding protein